MDCDDFMLLLAKPSLQTRSSSENAGYRVHELECLSCQELARHMQTEPFEEERDVHFPLEPSEQEEPDDLIGQTIGAYTIRKLIGSGGMGRVYLAVHPEIESRVAIKVFSKDWNIHPKLVARFFAEAHATNVIAHENIVNVLDVGRLEDDRPYMMMEHLSGWPLSKLVGSESLTDPRIGQIMLDVLSALSAAHQHKIIHRDLKPDNIFVSPEGRATLLDFGIAKLIPEIVGDSAPTATGTILGTPHYMSPEQAVGDDIDTRTDVYAMGIILYECFTGRRPFQGNSLYRLLDQHVNRTPTAPCQIRPDLDPEIEDVITKAMEKAPADRFASTGEMRTALAACAGIRGDTTGVLQAASLTRTDPTFETTPGRPHQSSKQHSSIHELAGTVEDVKPSPPSRVPAFLAAGLLGAIGISVAIWAALPSDNTRRAQLKTSGLDAGPIAISTTDAATLTPLVVDSGVITTADIQVDAAIAIASNIRPPRPISIKPKRKGIRPLSLFSTAQRLAQAERPDAVLLRINLTGMNPQGGIELGTAGNKLVFDFLSPGRAQKAFGKKFGRCIVRVEYSGSQTPTVSQKSGRCETLRPLARPQCSMSTFLTRRQAAGKLPAIGSPIDAVLQVSKGRSIPYWSITVSGTSYKQPPC